jgi:hypothetical protein
MFFFAGNKCCIILNNLFVGLSVNWFISLF